MQKSALFASAILTAVAAMTTAASAQRWVSSTGTTAAGSACSRTAPCATFQLAHDSTLAGPLQIYCVDSGNFGPLTINKSMSVDCSGVEADATTITVNTGSSGVVRIRGVKLNNSTGNESFGIYGSSVGSLFVENCSITNFAVGYGILVQAQSGSSPVRATISDTVLKGNNRGIAFQTGTGAGGIRASLERSQISGNVDGIVGFGDTNGNEVGPLSVVITNSTVSANSGNGALLQSTAGRANVSMTFDRSSIIGNTGAGIQTTASNTFALLSGTTVIANGTGLRTNSGSIQSYRNNALLGNFIEGAPTAGLTLN